MVGCAPTAAALAVVSPPHRPRFGMTLCALLLISLTMICLCPSVDAKGIYTTIEASWTETPLLQEGCEWASKTHGASAFFTCMEGLWARANRATESGDEGDEEARRFWSGGARTLPQREQYNVIRDVISEMPQVTPSQLALFQMEMAARSYSPAVEAHYTLAERTAQAHGLDNAAKGNSADDSSSETYLGERVKCNGSPFAAVYQRGKKKSTLFHSTAGLSSWAEAMLTGSVKQEEWVMETHANLDHVFPQSSDLSSALMVVVLYGLVGEPATQEWYTTVQEIIAQSESRVYAVFCHLPASVRRACGLPSLSETTTHLSATTEDVWDAPLYVQGYGATVDFKNMEYKVVDEKKKTAADKSDDQASAVLEGAESAVLGGFNLRVLKERYPALSVQLDEFTGVMEEAIGKEETKVDFDLWELQNVGVAATQYVREVKEDKERLPVLLDVVTRFPLYASKLSKIAVNPSRYAGVQAELPVYLQRGIANGATMAFLNGRELELKDWSIYGVLDRLREEEALMADMHLALASRRPALPGTDAASTVVAVDDSTMLKVVNYVKRTVRRKLTDQADSNAARRIAIPEEVILWVSNVEKDEMFKGLSRQLQTALQRNAYGREMMPRRNLVHIVHLIDPTTVEGLRVVMQVYRMLNQGVFARIGFVFVDSEWKDSFASGVSDKHTVSGESVVSSKVAKIYGAVYTLLKNERRDLAMQFLLNLAQAAESASSAAVPDSAVATFSRRFLSSVGESMSDVLTDRQFIRAYHNTQTAMRQFPFGTYPVSLVNGVKVMPGDRGVWNQLPLEVKQIRKLISKKVLKDSTPDFYPVLMKQYNAATRFQPAIEAATTELTWSTKGFMDVVQFRPYLFSSTYDGDVPTVTNVVYLPCDATLDGLNMARVSLVAMEECKQLMTRGVEDDNEVATAAAAICGKTRLTVASCPANIGRDTRGAMAVLERLLVHAGAASTPSDPTQHRVTLVRSFIDYVQQVASDEQLPPSTKLSSPELTKAFVTKGLSDLPEDVRAVVLAESEDIETQWTLQQGLLREMEAQLQSRIPDLLESAKGMPLLLSNGRTAVMDASFTAEDVMEMARQQMAQGALVYETLQKVDFAQLRDNTNTDEAARDAAAFTADEMDNAFYAAKTACISSIVTNDNARGGMRESRTLPSMQRLPSLTFTVEAAAESAGARHQMTIVVDPSSRDSQLLVSLSDFLARSPIGVSLNVYLNPSTEVKRPIRDLYTYVSSSTLTFDDSTGRVIPPAAVFRGLPTQSLLTLGVEEPESWTVFPHKAEYDLDNIILARLPAGSHFVTAEYRINSILVSGSASEGSDSPSGLPLTLRPTVSSLVPKDTLVMSEFGYYQLQAAPGVWHLSVQPGPIAAAFHIHSVNDIVYPITPNRKTGKFNTSAGQRIPVVIDSFRGKSLDLKVQRSPGYESASLGDIAAKIASRARRRWPPSKVQDRPTKPEKPTLNIFSVASGHLYERFLRMMMYSVFTQSSDKFGANTTRIKFWVIENFLSPQFKAYIPKMAAYYGYEVGFVTYHWPWWLPKQTEKQRKIWAYKILFLDVLFPLDVDRVIFVDADQTDRADLHELYNMDIDGSPIAMTPFCMENMNHATKGFRFWDQGFWVSHLRGRPYHISAIFVIDLQRFRATGAGDQYRTVYSQLAGDPNSLSNLDQDLPNYLQSSVPIYSLPEEWLWCETWCTMESKSRAKTIDLCNNPLTKMPKLDNAKLIIPNWEELDNMLEDVQKKVMAEDTPPAQQP